MTTASSLRSAGSPLGDLPGALGASTVLIRLSSVRSPKDCRTQANALHLKHPSHSGLDVVPAHGRRMVTHGCRSQPFRPAREELELLWSRTRAEDWRPEPPRVSV